MYSYYLLQNDSCTFDKNVVVKVLYKNDDIKN